MPKRSPSPLAQPDPKHPKMAAPTLTSQLLIKRLSPHATLPTRGSAFAAGLDLYACGPPPPSSFLLCRCYLCHAVRLASPC